MKLNLDFVVGAVLAICAVIVSFTVVSREFFTSPAQTLAPPKLIKSWREVFAKGRQVGNQDAPVKLIEFSDFECPFCAEFHRNLRQVQTQFPDEIALSYIHFPVAGHRFAVLAARVAECAGTQGRFETMLNELFERQDEFGLTPWTEFGTAAGVPNIAAFEACVKSTSPIQRVNEGKALGASLGVLGTPTVIINGWKLSQPPSATELTNMVKAILAGKSPVEEP